MSDFDPRALGETAAVSAGLERIAASGDCLAKAAEVGRTVSGKLAVSEMAADADFARDLGNAMTDQSATRCNLREETRRR